MPTSSTGLRLEAVLRLLSERGVMHTIDVTGIISLRPRFPSTPRMDDEPRPGDCELVDMYCRMKWTVMRASRDADLATVALQVFNEAKIEYRFSDLGSEGYLFGLPLGNHSPGNAERHLCEEGWTVLATYSRAKAGEYAAALDVLAQHGLLSWKQVEDAGCFFYAARLIEHAPPEQDTPGPPTSVATSSIDEADAELQSYYRHLGYEIVRVRPSFHFKLCSCLSDLQDHGMVLRYNTLTSPDEGSPRAETVIAVRCGQGKEAKYGGGKGERDAALRKEGYAVLVTFSATQAGLVCAALEKMHTRGVPLEWKITEQGRRGTHIVARCGWPPAEDERREGDDSVVVVSSEESDTVRHRTCHGLRDLAAAGLDMQWRLCDGVVTVSPWDAF